MNQISGLFLPLTEKEKEDIYNKLQELEYTNDIKGLKDFIIDTLFAPEETEENIEKDNMELLKDFIENNPELINKAKNTVSDIIGKIKKVTF